MKLDPTLSDIQLSINGYGGLIALDHQGDIYVAGTALGDPYQGLPKLPAGALQSSHAGAFCYYSYSSGDPSGPLAYSCDYQYIAEIDPVGNLLWATYVTGTYGATPAAIALDSENNVIVAGTTNSTDYPLTAGALETAYPPNGSALPGGVTSTSNASWALSATGYITKLNPTGSALVWSTYFGGSYSSDLPGLSDVPNGCRPSPGQVLEFVARIAAGGEQTVTAELVCGAPVSCGLYLPDSPCGGTYGGACLFPGIPLSCGGMAGPYSGFRMALRPDGAAVVAGANVAAVDFLKLPPVSLRHRPRR